MNKQIADNAIDSLVANLAAHNPLYAKLDGKRVGRSSRAVVCAASFSQHDVFDKVDVGNTLFPTLEYDELELSVYSLAKAASYSYLYWLEKGSWRARRAGQKANFPALDGGKIEPGQYAKEVWALRYAEEFRCAAEAGIGHIGVVGSTEAM